MMTRRRYVAVLACAAGVLLLYIVGGCLGVRLLRRYGAEAARIRQSRIDAVTASPAMPAPGAGRGPSDEANAVNVKVALTVTRIAEVAFKASAWTADFDISFRWRGDGVVPGTNFRVVDGQVEENEKVASSVRAGERYEEYRLVARIAKPFDPSRFPFGDQGLILQIEDTTRGVETVRYVADQSASGVSSEAMPRNARLTGILAGVTAGNGAAGRPARSRFFLAMAVASNGVQMYVTLFQALFAAVAVALIALFIKPTHVDPRFGLPVGAFFATVGNNIFVSSQLPASDRLSLAGLTNATGLATIFLILVQSAVSLHIADGLRQERLAQFLDRAFFAALVLGYGVVNLALPLAADAH